MYEQFESMKSMGPFTRLLKMIPGMTYNVPEEMMETAEETIKKWRVIIQSMTPEEREKPKNLSRSRIRRVAHGSGTQEKDVRELLERYKMLRRMMKTMRRKKLPFFGKQFPTP
jgi:signal recognition particle subunit SRP54